MSGSAATTFHRYTFGFPLRSRSTDPGFLIESDPLKGLPCIGWQKVRWSLRMYLRLSWARTAEAVSHLSMTTAWSALDPSRIMPSALAFALFHSFTFCEFQRTSHPLELARQVIIKASAVEVTGAGVGPGDDNRVGGVFLEPHSRYQSISYTKAVSLLSIAISTRRGRSS